MKKTFSLLMVILIFISTSCQRTEDVIPDDSKVDLGVIKEFQDAGKSSKRLLFNVLTPTERLYVWKKNLELLQISGQLSDVQKPIVKEIQDNLSVELYDENYTKLRENFLSKFMPEWMNKAKKVFSEYELKSLLMLPVRYSGGAISIKEPTETNNLWTQIETKSLRPQNAGCDCHGGTSYDCNSTNGVLRCVRNSCDGSSWGCGGWWMESCDYVCMRNNYPDQYQ